MDAPAPIPIPGPGSGPIPPTPPPPTAARRSGAPSVAIVGTFVLFGFVISSFFPFFSLFLTARSLSPSEVGVVIAAMAVMRIVMNPVWGSLADARLGRRRVLQLGLTGSIVAALLLSGLGNDLTWVLVTAALLAAFSGQTGPNIDALTLANLDEAGRSNYGRIRAWESFSYAVGCIGFGLLLDRVGATWLMAVNAAAMLAVLAWSRALPADRPTHRVDHGRMGTVGAVFREAPRFWGFLAGVLLLWTGFNGAWNFLALRIESRGGGPLLVGVGAALGGLVEVAVMLNTGRLTRRIGLRTVYALGACVYALAFVLWGVVKSPVVVSLLTVFEGLGFALLFTSGVVIVGTLLPKSLYSTGQSLMSTVAFGIGPIVGGAVGGWVFQHVGEEQLYLGAAALALAGGAVVWLSLTGAAFRGREREWPAPEGPATFPSGEAGAP